LNTQRLRTAFIALFNLLGQDIGLRGASFLGIDDLSKPDQLFALGFTIPLFGSHFNLLPAMMAISMLMVTNLTSPPGADSAQKRSQNRNMSILATVFFVLYLPVSIGIVALLDNIQPSTVSTATTHKQGDGAGLPGA
jgi:membrane protein insertase Oxa1/YidC/SpoIIIJ